MTSLSFFRIKPDFSKPEEIINNREKLTVEPVRLGGMLIGQLHLQRTVRAKPSWLAYFDGTSLDLGVPLGTASLAAVLLVKNDNTHYALVFGYGASLLKDGVIDERFGLRATLNAVEASQLRSVDHKRLEATSRHTRENLSRAGTLLQFGLDINRDLLRAVTGKPKDATFGTRMSGSDQLTVTADVPIKHLKTALATYGELAEQDSYKTNFPWVDNIRDIRDKTLTAELDKRLAKELASGSDNVWLAPPEVIDWAATAGFKYRNTKRAPTYPDLELEDYGRELGSLKDLNGARLQQDRIYHVRTETDVGTHSWPVIRCLIAEIEYKKDRYVLSEGTWFRIDADFLGSLNDYVSGIPTTQVDLPDYDGDKDEGAYNKRAWERDKSRFALLDKSFIQYPGRGKVEVCDLYSRDKQLIHVKRINGSSTLSHLFNQGAVSAELLRGEVKFRTEFLKKIPSLRWGNPSDPIVPADFEVCYAIVRRPGQSLELPFFSKLTLRTTAQHLRGLGFRVSTIGIPCK